MSSFHVSKCSTCLVPSSHHVWPMSLSLPDSLWFYNSQDTGIWNPVTQMAQQCTKEMAWGLCCGCGSFSQSTTSTVSRGFRVQVATPPNLMASFCERPSVPHPSGYAEPNPGGITFLEAQHCSSPEKNGCFYCWEHCSLRHTIGGPYLPWTHRQPTALGVAVQEQASGLHRNTRRPSNYGLPFLHTVLLPSVWCASSQASAKMNAYASFKSRLTTISSVNFSWLPGEDSDPFPPVFPRHPIHSSTDVSHIIYEYWYACLSYLLVAGTKYLILTS